MGFKSDDVCTCSEPLVPHGHDFGRGLWGNFRINNEIENLIKMSKVDFEKQIFEKKILLGLENFFLDFRQGGTLLNFFFGIFFFGILLCSRHFLNLISCRNSPECASTPLTRKMTTTNF